MKKRCDPQDLRQLLHDFGIRGDDAIRTESGGDCLIIHYQGMVLRVGLMAQLHPAIKAQVIEAAGESGLPVPKIIHIGETEGTFSIVSYLSTFIFFQGGVCCSTR